VATGGEYRDARRVAVGRADGRRASTGSEPVAARALPNLTPEPVRTTTTTFAPNISFMIDVIQ
jgi:hypothetical protein